MHAPPGVCKTCGGSELRTVSETITEVLAYVPARFEVNRHVRPACSCRKCETMVQAPMPDLPIPRGMVDASFLAHIVVDRLYEIAGMRSSDAALLQGAPRVAEVACWSHVRRGFYDEYVSHKSAIAKEALDRIGALFDIERPIAGAPPDIRRAARQRTARPRIDELATWLDEQLNKLPGKSDLAGAIRYARSRWLALTRYLDDGRLEISNNAAESQIRPAALGRNYAQVRIMRSCRRRRPWERNRRSARYHRPARQLHIIRGFAGTASAGRAACSGCRLGRRLQSPERPLLHREIRLDIHVGRRWALMAEPQGNHGHVDARLQQVHGRGVPEGMRRDRAGQ